MPLIRVSIILTLFLLGIITAAAQTPPTPPAARPTQTPQSVIVDCSLAPSDPKCKPVVVTQGFLDDATAAFTLVPSLQASLKTALNAVGASEQAKADAVAHAVALDKEIAAYKNATNIDDKINALHKIKDTLYEQIISIQQSMLDRMAKQLNKSPSLFDKVMKTLEKIAILAAGVGIGRAGL